MNLKGLVFFNIIVLALGIAFLFVSAADRVLSLIVAAGATFILLALINLLLVTRRRRVDTSKNAPEGYRLTQASARAQRPGAGVTFIGWLCSIGAAILGVVMVVTPATFTSFLIYIFAVAIFLGGCYHIYMLSKGIAPARLPAWVYIFPLILIIGAVVMFMLDVFVNRLHQTTIILASGIGMIIFAVTSFIEIFGYKAAVSKTPEGKQGKVKKESSTESGAHSKEIEKTSSSHTHDVEDVTATEVK